MPLASASGYPAYTGSLIPPMFSSKLVEQFYCTSTYADITTTEYTGELNRCGDQITFFRSPRVRVRRGQKDSTIRHVRRDVTQLFRFIRLVALWLAVFRSD